MLRQINDHASDLGCLLSANELLDVLIDDVANELSSTLGRVSLHDELLRLEQVLDLRKELLAEGSGVQQSSLVHRLLSWGRWIGLVNSNWERVGRNLLRRWHSHRLASNTRIGSKS